MLRAGSEARRRISEQQHGVLRHRHVVDDDVLAGCARKAASELSTISASPISNRKTRRHTASPIPCLLFFGHAGSAQADIERLAA